MGSLQSSCIPGDGLPTSDVTDRSRHNDLVHGRFEPAVPVQVAGPPDMRLANSAKHDSGKCWYSECNSPNELRGPPGR